MIIALFCVVQPYNFSNYLLKRLTVKERQEERNGPFELNKPVSRAEMIQMVLDANCNWIKNSVFQFVYRTYPCVIILITNNKNQI